MTGPAAYERAKTHYRSVEIAETYDSWRYESARGRRRNQRDLAAIERAVAEAERRGAAIATGLDLPCGTGRLAPLLRRRGVEAVGADIALEMMRVARRKQGAMPYIQCNAEQIPHRDGAFDAVFSIRFLFHLDAGARSRILREMRRVSRRWLVLDARHRYNLRSVAWRLAFRVGVRKEIPFRFSRRGLAEELRAAGWTLIAIYPSRRLIGFFSDKWIALAEKAPAIPPPGPAAPR
jgi:SAM-dependent methyltransferase